VRFPTRVTVLSAMMAFCLSAGRLDHAASCGLMVGQAEELVADDFVREPHVALQLVQGAGCGNDVEEDVVALFLLVDLIGEAALPPPLRMADRATPSSLDLVVHDLDPALGDRFIEVAIEDDAELIGTHGV
jgi:hypothetical protein